MSKTDAALPTEKPAALPSHIILQADWGGYPAGRVLRADADLIGALNIERVKFREATRFERGIAGFSD